MNAETFSTVTDAIQSLKIEIANGNYQGYQGVSPTDGWGGAGVGFSTIPIDQGPQGFYPNCRIVVTPHAHAAGWLIDKLGNVFVQSGLIDHCSKIEFYGRLASAAQRYQSAMAGKPGTAEGMLQALLGEAIQMLTEMHQGVFTDLMMAVGNEIAADHAGYSIDANSVRYFAYGSNMDEQQMTYRCPGAVLIGKAKLENYRFMINSRGVATVVYDSEHSVYGLVWQINREHEASLDGYEGVRTGTYTKQCMPVMCNDSTHVHTLVYVASNSEAGELARHGYLEKILHALNTHLMPDKYIDEISTMVR